MKRLKNKNCVITGAASGIGRSLAIGLAKEGMNLFLVDIDEENLEKVKKEIELLGAKAFTGIYDISKYDDFVQLAKDIYSKFHDIDLLINNAGISGGGFVDTLELEKDWKRIFDVNLWSVIYSLKVFLPKMIERGSGHIVNTGSGAGVVGLPCHLHYVASKFAVVGITEGLYSELSSKGLEFSVICPTVIKTNIINRSDVNIPKDILETLNQQDINKGLEEFKQLFWKKYSENGLTPDQAAKKYIKGIKKHKLYIFDKKLVPIAMFIKGFSRKLYKKVLRKEGKDYFALINEVLSELDMKI